MLLTIEYVRPNDADSYTTDTPPFEVICKDN